MGCKKIIGLRFFVLVAIAFGCILFAPNRSSAAPGLNEQLNYQARLLNNTGAVVPDGNYNIEFKLYQDGDGVLGGGDETLVWTETRTTGNRVVVKNGYFVVGLGSVTPFSGVDWHQDTLWLSTNIGGTGEVPAWDGEMSPFRRLSAAPYAMNSKLLGGRNSSQYLQIAPDIVQTDTTTTTSLFLNKVGASGNIVQLQKNGTDIFTIQNDGTLKIGAADAFATLAVFDSKSGGDPTGIGGGLYYNTDNQRFRCFEAGAWKDCIGAPTGAEFLVLQADPYLDNERILAAGTNVVISDGGANNNLTIHVCSETCAWTGDISPSQITSDQNDYNPAGLSTATVLRLNSNAFRELTGLVGGSDGRLLILNNIGSFPIALRNENADSTAANRFALPHDYVIIAPNQTASLMYDLTSGRWRLQQTLESVNLPGWRSEINYEYGWAQAPTNNTHVGDGLISSIAGIGAGNSVSTTPDQNHPGVAAPTTGTSSSGQAALRSHFSAYRFGGGQYYFATSLRLPVLSNGSDDFIYYAGFGDSVTSEPSDGCYFRYNDNQASGQWQGVCRNNDVEASTAGVTIQANTWYRLEIIVNPSGNTASFFVNGTKIGADITSEIPTAAGRETGLICHNIRKTSGSNARTAEVDFCTVYSNLSDLR